MATIISRARLLTESGLSGPSDVRIADGVIESVTPTGDAAARAEGADVVDGSGRFLIPGLIDTHVHFTSEQDLHGQAANGVITSVDLGTYPPTLVDGLRNRPGLTD